MRLFEYKCTNGKTCYYSFELDGESKPCEKCGLTYEDAQTIWAKIRLAYYRLIPYEWRPKNAWHALKCWAWHRYTTVKPRNLPHTWYDRSGLILEVVVEVARRFIEQETKNEWVGDEEWQKEHNPEFYASWKETKEILAWWDKYTEFYVYDLSEEDLYKEYEKIFNEVQAEGYCNNPEEVKGRVRFKAENAREAEQITKCKRLIELSPYYWT